MWARTGPLESLEKRASQAYKGPLDSLGRRAPLAPRGKTGDLGTPDREENWAFKVKQAHLVQPASWVLRERQEKQGLWARGARPALPALLVNKVSQDWRAERGPRGTWGRWVPLGRKAHLDRGASLAPKDPQGTLDLLV